MFCGESLSGQRPYINIHNPLLSSTTTRPNGRVKHVPFQQARKNAMSWQAAYLAAHAGVYWGSGMMFADPLFASAHQAVIASMHVPPNFGTYREQGRVLDIHDSASEEEGPSQQRLSRVRAGANLRTTIAPSPHCRDTLETTSVLDEPGDDSSQPNQPSASTSSTPFNIPNFQASLAKSTTKVKLVHNLCHPHSS